MEFTEEFIKEHGLSEAQAAAVKTFGADYVATVKKEYDGKANTDAEGIISGAASKVESVTGVARNQGEKHADYLERASQQFLSNKQGDLEKLKADYEAKIKGVTGAEELQKELEDYRAKVDTYQKRVAELEPLAGIDEKYKNLETSYNSMKQQTAYTSVKPVFPESVNPYEAAAKWDAFRAKVEAENTIEIVDGVAIAVNKENTHKQTKLADLVAADPELSELVKGRQQNGLGGKPATETIEGVPFKIPAEATSEEKSDLIRKHLLEVEQISITSPKYTARFAELHKKMQAGK